MRITTPSFQLATYAAGRPQAARVALVLPGFLDTKDHPHMRSHVDYLSARGYYALSFDPPGTWGSGGDISTYTMTNWLSAIRELIAHLGSRPTFVMGTSRGGTMAMLAAVRDPRVTGFAAVMSKASYAPGAGSSHPMDDWQRDGFREFRVTIPGRPGHKQDFRVPYSVVEDTQRYDLTADLHQLIKPKLFIAGSRDTTVPPDVVRVAFEAAGEPKQLQTVDSEHLYRRDPAMVDQVNQLVGGFLDEHDQYDGTL